MEFYRIPKIKNVNSGCSTNSNNCTRSTTEVKNIAFKMHMSRKASVYVAFRQQWQTKAGSMHLWVCFLWLPWDGLLKRDLDALWVVVLPYFKTAVYEWNLKIIIFLSIRQNCNNYIEEYNYETYNCIAIWKYIPFLAIILSKPVNNSIILSDYFSVIEFQKVSNQ